MSVIPDPDTQDQLHTAWMAHFSNDPSHTRSLQLCAKHIVMQAKELFHGRPNSVVRCPWPMASAAATALATMACAGCGGDACGDGGSGPRCGMSATSISGLLAHHAHFHYRDAVTTDWVSMEVSDTHTHIKTHTHTHERHAHISASHAEHDLWLADGVCVTPHAG